MKNHAQKNQNNPGPALLSVAEILANVLMRRLAEDRWRTSAEKT